MLLVIVLKGCHRGLWNAQRLMISRSLSGPSTAAQSTRGDTPCVGGPPPTVPLGPSPKKQAKACKVAGTSTQLEPSTSLQPPGPPSRTPEAILVLRRDLCLRNPRMRHLESPRGRGKAACRLLGGGS